MILVDTSVWVEHLRHGHPRLASLLDAGDVLVHPLVIAEIACGSLKDRTQILALFRALPEAVVATEEEVYSILEKNRLYGLGLGWIDISLLASARLSSASLWTFDNALARAAQNLHVSFCEK